LLQRRMKGRRGWISGLFIKLCTCVAYGSSVISCFPLYPAAELKAPPLELYQILQEIEGALDLYYINVSRNAVQVEAENLSFMAHHRSMQIERPVTLSFHAVFQV
jgi:hypothetical protein